MSYLKKETYEIGKVPRWVYSEKIWVRKTNRTSVDIATDVSGRKIIRSGTPFPSNDASAIGLVTNDYDVTDENAGAIVEISVTTGGMYYYNLLPVTLAAEAKTALAKVGLFGHEFPNTVRE